MSTDKEMLVIQAMADAVAKAVEQGYSNPFDLALAAYVGMREMTPEERKNIEAVRSTLYHTMK